ARDLGALDRSRHEDHLQRGVLDARAADEVDAVEPGHRDVGDEEVGALLVQRCERADGIGEGTDMYALHVVEGLREQLGLIRIVIEDEYRLHPTRRYPPPATCEASPMPIRSAPLPSPSPGPKTHTWITDSDSTSRRPGRAPRGSST